MSILELVKLGLTVSLSLIVLSLGLRCSLREATFLMRAPGLLARSVLAMNVIFPLLAVLALLVTDLTAAVKVALIAYAVSPLPPVLPNKQLKLVSRDDYVYGLLVATSILSIALIPLSLFVIGAVFDRDVAVDISLVARPVALSILIPIAAGMLVRQVWPGAAPALSRIIGIVGNVLLVAACIPILVIAWKAFGSLLGDGTLLVCVALGLLGLAVGHVLGGPDGDNRSVLALATSARHPGVAIAIGGTFYSGDKRMALAVLLALIVAFVASIPYTAWRKRRHMRVIGSDATDHTRPLPR